MSKVVTLTTEDELATMTIARDHGNAINLELLEGLIEACATARSDEEVRGVLLTGAGKLFCPGLDLQELIDFDRSEMEEFLARFSECLLAMYTFPKPLVAAIHGHAIAGGYILSLTADWRVMRENVVVGLNEVRVGVPLPFGVSMMLRESGPAARLEEVALFGRNYTNQDALAAGLVHEVHPAEVFESRCLERLRELAAKDSRAFAVTKRYLRAPTVERIHRHDDQFRYEFLDCWFAPGTRKRIRRLVDELRGGD